MTLSDNINLNELNITASMDLNFIGPEKPSGEWSITYVCTYVYFFVLIFFSGARTAKPNRWRASP